MEQAFSLCAMGDWLVVFGGSSVGKGAARLVYDVYVP